MGLSWKIEDEVRMDCAQAGSLMRELDEVVKLGSLLTPYVETAINKMSAQDLASFQSTIGKCERILSNQQVLLKHRLFEIQMEWIATHGFASEWIFIGNRIEELRTGEKEPAFQEYSTMSLILGMIWEKSSARLLQLNPTAVPEKYCKHS